MLYTWKKNFVVRELLSWLATRSRPTPKLGQQNFFRTFGGSDRTEIIEAMATSIEHYITDLQYGTNHSGVHPDFSRWAYTAEQLMYWPGATTNFIPEGLFFDLFDENGVFPISGTNAPPEVGWVADQVNNFSFEDQIEALDEDCAEMDCYLDDLWSGFGASSGNSLSDFQTLRTSYGY